jgi:hypothetical protein
LTINIYILYKITVRSRRSVSRWRRWTLLGALLGSLGACAPPSQQVPLPAAGLEVRVPADWQIQAVRDQTLLFVRPVEGGKVITGAYLMLVRHPQRPEGPTPPLETYVEFSEQQARQFARHYQLLSAGPAAVAGLPARRHLREWQGQSRSKRELALLWIDQAHGYQLTAVAAPEQFERLRPQYERVVASLRRNSDGI